MWGTSRHMGHVMWGTSHGAHHCAVVGGMPVRGEVCVPPKPTWGASLCGPYMGEKHCIVCTALLPLPLL